MKICVFPGSFDPITSGHEDLVRRVLPLFDKIIIAIGINSQKSSLFTLEHRVETIKTVFADEPKVIRVTHLYGYNFIELSVHMFIKFFCSIFKRKCQRDKFLNGSKN